MGIEYYVGFTDVDDEGIDMVPALIESFRERVFEPEEFEREFGQVKKLEFIREELPYVGPINVFRTDSEDVAQLVYQELSTLCRDLDAYVFPVNSSEV